MKEYCLIIKDKKGRHYFECKNLKECEEKLFDNSNEIFNFEIYKQIENNELIDLGILCFERFKKSNS